jgi:BON domain-containing protein
MHNFRIAMLALLVISFTASCSRLGTPSDDAITTDIKAKMFSEPLLKNASVDVSTHGGVVTLTGQVPDDGAHLAAFKIASQEKGVTKVNDQISVTVAQAVPDLAAPAAAAAPEPAPRPAKRSRATKPAGTREAASVSEPASASQPAPEAAAAPAPPPPPQPVTVTVPANTIVTIRTIDSIDSKTNQAGQVFRASLDVPIVVDNKVIVPAGADAYIKLADAQSAGHMTGRSELGLELASILFQGKTYNVVSSDVKQSGTSRGKQTAERVGGGAALGALIGAIAGGGKGAAIGAAVGGGAGTGAQILTHGQQVKIPSETRLDFTLQQPLDITYIPGNHSQRHSSAGQASSDQPPSNPPLN